MSPAISAAEKPQNEFVNSLLAKMTLREKLGQCILIEPCFCLEARRGEKFNEEYDGLLDSKYLNLLLEEYKIGGFLFGGASRVGDGSPEAWAHFNATLSEGAKNTRLGIPVLIGGDAVHGVNFMKGSTIYSHNLGVAATWNVDLTMEYANTVSKELKALGFNCNFAPTADVARDQRWGRVYETFGEDPFLASKFSSAYVEGCQTDDRLAGCAKHFIGYSESKTGMDRQPADLSDRNIYENHIPPFEAAIESGVMSIMVSGGDVNGTPVPASRKLMIDLLRTKMGFEGVTMSDWEDVERLNYRHNIASSHAEALARAFNAGLDLNMAVTDLAAVPVMEQLVEDGTIPMERVDEAAGRILNLKYQLGLFSNDPIDTAKAQKLVGNQASKDLAYDIAAQSMVLLKNDDALLPLTKNVGSILVVGEAAHSKRHLCAGWTMGWAGAKEEDVSCATILDALKDQMSEATSIKHVDTLEALLAAGESADEFDLCICVLSEEPHAEWLGDTTDLAVHRDEFTLHKTAAEMGIPTVLVSLLGRPLDMTWFAENVPAILWAWSPGTEGAKAVVDTLLGAINPQGKLPVTFPSAANQIPTVYNALRFATDESHSQYNPLYEFGFGLSYSAYQYADIEAPDTVKRDENIDVTVRVKNTGDVAGTEIIQLFVRDVTATVSRPMKSLKAFTRVALKPDEEQTMSLSIPASQLKLYNEDLELVDEPRKIIIEIGTLSKEIKIQ